MANESIDKVQVEVEASAKGVSQVFTQLERQLTTLKNALGNINTKNLSQIANINTAGMSKAEKDISNSANKIKQALAGLESYKNAALSGDSSSLTSFNRRIISIQSAIDTLREKMGQVGATTVESSQFTTLKNQAEELDNKLLELKSKMADVTSGNVTLTQSEFNKLTDDIKDTSSALDDVNSKMQEMVGNGTAYINADTLTAELQGAKAEVDSFVETTNNAKPTLDTSGITESLSGIASQASEAASRLLTLVGNSISSGIRSITSGFSKMRSAISNLGKASSYTSSMFGKILRYGFGIRSLYVLFRRLREAVKDSFTELQKSGAEFQTTKANIDALKTSLSTLKYQFGAAFEPIFNTIAPALQTLINYLISAMNTLSAFIAKITGRSTYSKVATVTTKVASGAGSAAKAVKELNKQLQGFDELNNLDLDSGSSGGGGGGGSSSGGDVVYEEASVESALSNFASNLADMIKAGDWEGVGSAISEKLTEALNSIPWTTIKQKAKNFGTNLANFFNGFITSDLFSSIGTSVAEAFNTAFTFLNTFGKTFDWTNFGNSIGEGINSFFKDADFAMWGDTVHTWVGGILDAGIELLTTTDFNEIGTKFGDFLEGVQVSDLLGKVKKLCSNLITAIGDTLTGFKNNTSEKTKLETALGGLLGVLTITGNVPATLTLAAVIGGIELGGKLYELATGNKVTDSFISEIQQIVDGLFGDNKIEWKASDLIDFVFDDFWSGVGLSETQKDNIKAIFSPAYLFGQDYFRISVADWITFDGVSVLIASIQQIGEKIKTAISNIWNGQTYSEAMVGANGMASEAAQNTKYSSGLKSKFEELGKNIHDGIKEGFTIQAQATIWASPVLALYQAIHKAVCDKFEINSPAKAMYSLGENIFYGIVEGFKNAMTSYGWLGLLGDLYDYFNGNKTTTTKTGYTAKENFINSDFRNKINVNINTKMTGQAKSKQDVDNLKTSFSNLNTEASKTNTATYKADVGGKIAEITDLDTWKKKIENLTEKWQSKSATMRANVGGQIESIDELSTNKDSWADKIESLKSRWENAGTKTSFNVTSDVDKVDKGNDSWLSRLAKAATTWKGTTPIATFTTNLAGTLNTASSITSIASAFSTLKSNFPSGAHSSSWSTTLSGASASEMNTYASAAKSVYDNFYTGPHTATWTMSVQGDTSGLDNFVNTIVNKLNDKLSKYRVTIANVGGIINHGVRTSIPQYAGGTLNAGTMFIAGEAGPEIMGHINGRTEILNRSQIGSIIHSSFVTAMSQFGNRMLTTPESISYNSGSYNGYSGYNGDGNAESRYLMAEQNALLREQNELLKEIADKDMSISSRDVFNATRSEANSYYRRTGNSPFLV